MDMISLSATARDAKLKPRQLRRSGQVPCVVYGAGQKNQHIQVAENVLHKAFDKAGESSLVELDIAGKKVPVLFKNVDFDPISDREIHADFYAVDMKKEIDTLVPVHFEGEAPAVKELSGVLVTVHASVRVRCLPADLPHSLTVSVSGLKEFHATVSVKDLEVPKGVKVMDDPSQVLVTVQEPRQEEVITPVATAAVPGAEGAAAAPGAEGAATAADGAAPAAGAPGAPAAGKDKEKGGKEKK